MKKVLLVTGGSRGIGAATAILAAEQGYAVAINYREQKKAADRVVKQIHSTGGEAIAIQADIAVENEVKRMFDELDQNLGRLTALVNNAGIIAPQSRFEDIELERINRLVAVNVIGTMLCSRQAVLRMSKDHGGNGGTIVNLTSRAANLGSPNEYVDYAATKGAIDTFTKGLAVEVASKGTRVNAVRAGVIDTEIHATFSDADPHEMRAQTIPMKRLGTADEIAQAIVWLLSDEASYCSGTILDVTGGR